MVKFWLSIFDSLRSHLPRVETIQAKDAHTEVMQRMPPGALVTSWVGDLWGVDL